VSAPPEHLPHRPVTLADIAREAGTSASTASRALSGRGYVSDGVRDRLLEIADRLGYVPNASARTLKQRTSRAVGVVVTDLENPFYARLAAGVEETLRAAGYHMVLVSANGSAAEESAGARTFLALGTPGVILTPTTKDAAALLLRHRIPVVEVDRQIAGAQCDAVVVDNARGAREATRHLLELGHRRIGLLVVDTEYTTDAGRLRGYVEAHENADVPYDERLVVRVSPGAQDTDARIGALLDVEAPSAIFAANNQLAEHAWHVLRRRGLRLPHDISLVGFDDISWLEMVSPAITTVAQPTVEMGRRAARLLLRRIERPGSEHVTEVLQPWLMPRPSSGPPAGH
jgi:LacI family transcriptional regulator